MTNKQDTEVEMVRVGRDDWMSREDAYANGHNPRLDPPIKGEPFFAQGALSNLLFVIFCIAVGYFIHQWLGGAVRAVTGG